MSNSGKIDKAIKPDFTVNLDADKVLTIKLMGDWTLSTIRRIEKRYASSVTHGEFDLVIYDVEDLGQIDTAGAYILIRAIKCEKGICTTYQLAPEHKGARTLFNAAAEAVLGRLQPPPRPWYEMLNRVGESATRAFYEAYDTMAFSGRFLMVMMGLLFRPTRIRWKSVVALIEDVGLNAAPIIMLLSFFIGAVIAFMGANLLASFGAQVFMVDLVGFAVLREFACLITAIMLAGRSDSAFTAQIGAMRMRQEIDAMTVIGLDRYETLVIPRAIACLVSAPILTFAAMLSGLAGGMLVAWVGPTDISPILFVARLRETVPIENFWVGMVKTPFFAMLIATIGCRQGLAVTGSVESLGARTTSSVVQAIFGVIVMDALFAMLFLQMGV